MITFFNTSKVQLYLEIAKAYFRRRAETRRVENILARLSLAWHASVLDKENIAVLKQLY